MAQAASWIFSLYFSCALAAYVGFNYGATFTDGTAKQYSDFFNEFNSSQYLSGTSGFSSVRLYTTIQAGTVNTPSTAIQAALDTGSSLLLGLWASGGDQAFDAETEALTTVISTSGAQLEGRVVGISVGSEDLYQVSIGSTGAEPATLVRYIQSIRDVVAGTPLSEVSIGHVDTWSQWVNESNVAVINASDFIGFDGYPYYQYMDDNSIDQASDLFWAAMNATADAVGSKQVWVTETGWPTAGPTVGLAVPSISNAQTYWQTVGCAVFGSINTWWYQLQHDYDPTVSFGIVGPGNPPPTQPLFSVACGAGS